MRLPLPPGLLHESLYLEQFRQPHEGLDIVLEDAHLSVVHKVHEVG